MVSLLVLNSSVREDGSVTRGLVKDFVTKWRDANSGAEVIVRELGLSPIAGPNAAWTLANAKPESERNAGDHALLKISDELISELQAASHVLISAPMYNFGVPWTLKGYIDNIVRAGKTFNYDPATGFSPALAPSKKLIVVTASAGIYEGTPLAGFDHCTPYIRAIFGFIGFADIEVISAAGQWAPDDVRQASTAAAAEKLLELSSNW